eukprot:4930269-Lingulodinium_polyedra.AAC.1
MQEVGPLPTGKGDAYEGAAEDLDEADIMAALRKPYEMARSAGHGVPAVELKDFRCALRCDNRRTAAHGSPSI